MSFQNRYVFTTTVYLFVNYSWLICLLNVLFAGRLSQVRGNWKLIWVIIRPLCFCLESFFWLYLRARSLSIVYKKLRRNVVMIARDCLGVTRALLAALRIFFAAEFEFVVVWAQGHLAFGHERWISYLLAMLVEQLKCMKDCFKTIFVTTCHGVWVWKYLLDLLSVFIHWTWLI